MTKNEIINELTKVLQDIVKSSKENYPDSIEKKWNNDPPFEWWSPAGIMIKAEFIYNAQQLLNKLPPQ